MRQALLPGMDLPRRASSSRKDAQWPSTAELLTALAECDLPATFPPATFEHDKEHANPAATLPPQDTRIPPGLSFLQEACARVGLPWHDVRCVALYGREAYAELAVAALSGKPICLFTDAANPPDLIARFLLDRGVDWHLMHIFEHTSREQESSHACSLPEATGRGFGPACTVLLIPGMPLRGPYLGISGAQLAGEGGMLSSKSVRAAALAALRIRPDAVVWNLGAGSGAAALEACALANRSLVFAVERDPARVVCLEENRRRFGAANLEIIAGNAPDCLPSLPDPDAVLISGGIDKTESLHPLLSLVCSRLKPGGRLTIHYALLDSLARCRAFLQTLGWETRIRCIQVSETGPLGTGPRLAALNPVFLISAGKADSSCTQATLSS